MSLLDHLWDDTVAGPPPETGLGKLRKYRTFSSRQNSGSKETVNASADDGIKVSRSIMIIKPPGINQTGTPPVSPAGSTPPVSPFSELVEQEQARPFGSRGGQLRKSTRRQMELDLGAHVLLTTCEI